jgi:lipopolysaccharide biosynthesis protein
MAGAEKSIIVVLGMHRSGTSAFARALPVLGVNLGGNLMPAGVANDKGFFEDLDVKNLNEQFLTALGRRWDSLAPVQPEEMQGEVADRFRRLAAGHLRSKLGEGVYGLKDPRMCRLLPFWRDVLVRVKASPVFVIVYRNPASVAQSLAARDGFVVEKCHLLWLEHMYSSLRYSAGAPRLVVDYDRLVDEPATELSRIAQISGLPFDPQSSRFAHYRDEFIQRALRHSRVSLEESARDPKMPAIVLGMAALLSDLASGQCEFGAERFDAMLDRVAGWITDMRPTLGLMQACDDKAVALAKLVRDRDVRIEGLESFIADRHGQGEWATAPEGPACGNAGEPRRQLTIIDDVPGGRAVPLLAADPLREKVARLICFYLPQFHPIAENDEWWGAGFTEWVNVSAALAQFPGHAQPEIPGELAYYDLRDPAVQRRQVELAKLYGIEGFCFYFYWFGGRRLLEAPLLAYLADRTLDLPFCLCWANENWTRRWDGLEHEVLIGQNHSADDDNDFIAHVAQYMTDPRYIRVDGKPLLLVYRPGLFPDAKQTAARWRAWCRAHGIGEIFLAYTQSFDRLSPAAFGFDAAIEFPPDYASQPDMTDRIEGLNDGFRGVIHDWRILVERSRQYARPDYMLFRGVNPGWDNTARRGETAKIYCNSSVLGYQEWLFNAIGDTCERFAEPDRRLLFINAWNEWAEGAFLEPDRRRGYARLEATRVALVRQAIASARQSAPPAAGYPPQIGVVVHAYHEDVLEIILDRLVRLGAFDLYLYVTCAPERAQRVRGRLKNTGMRFELFECPNRGRDVLPFLLLLPRLLDAGHDLLLKLHTKKSEHRKDGHLWVSDLFDKLLSEAAISEAISHFQAHPGTGILGPGDHVIPMPHYWGRNAATVKRLSARLGIDASLLSDVRFVAGTMFFARPQSLLPLASLAIRADDFEEECGQIDGTLAHAMERLFSVSALAAGFATVSPGDRLPDASYRYAARTRLPPELATALLERTDALVERLRVTDAGMTKAQTLALERLDEIESLNERIEATDLALHAAEKLALGRLAEAGALRDRLALTEDALRGAEALALGRLQELEQYRQQLESTEKALREAERLALHRLDELAELQRRLHLTDVALGQAEKLALGRLAENQAMSGMIESAQECLRQARAREDSLKEEIDRKKETEARLAHLEREMRAAQVDAAQMHERRAGIEEALATCRSNLAAQQQRLEVTEARLRMLVDSIGRAEAGNGWRIAKAFGLVRSIPTGRDA